MKAIICVVAFVTVATVCRAEETTCLFSSLPPTVYLLTEPGGTPEASSVYEIQRGDSKTLVIFCTARSAELFLAALADAKSRKRYVSAVPKTFLLNQTFFVDLQKQGVSLLLDPKTPVACAPTRDLSFSCNLSKSSKSDNYSGVALFVTVQESTRSSAMFDVVQEAGIGFVLPKR